ncbi:hypothetical protein WOLCODRAFT_61126 [Wolfiporia cocos MD-104 SS10]|uniref:F-box domain-containing protein n=1 Tax=Wolfiporia cocos (strain MD-104) TaxID=742152 RepID=A0A2H3IWU4_WOLCO|nr:hypothetical protein WOLCODRAFT_61126 [Wolfiporia cocos MD-104 SS10]
MSTPPSSLSRHSSFAERISSALPPIRLRSRKSNLSSSSAENQNTNRTSSYRPYSVYQQTMYPAILRDPDATNKLLEAILETSGGRRSISRLARTCKAFMEPALNILWRDLDSFSPLIALFPNTLLKRTRRPGLGLAQNPKPEDWGRLLAYGERVRSISYIEASGSISASIFPIFEELRPRTWILPNLTSITWKSETAAGLERVRMFLGPELLGVTLEIGTRHPKLNDLLVEISSHAQLQSFSFTLHTNLPDNFTDIFQHNVALEKVAIAAPGALSSRVGKWAASLPNLRRFHLDLSGRTSTAVEGFFDDISPGSGYSTPSSVSDDDLDFSEIRKSAVRLTRDGPRRGAFARLTHLQLTGDVGNIATFLRHLTSPLVALELLIDDPPSPLAWQDVCGLVCEQFANTLQVLRVGPTPAARFSELVRSTSRGGDAPAYRLPLTHLGALPRLHRLDIDLPESVIFLNEDVAHLAAVCPNLEILRLCGTARFPQTVGAPQLTLDGLMPLTRYCRRLHTLAVVVNALEGSEETFECREASSRSLLRLNVGHSWVKDPLHTAILLSHLAPYLESLKFFQEKSRAGVVEANALAWQKVTDFLPHLQSIRLLERRQQPQPQVYVPPITDEKEVDATVITVDEGVSVHPEVVESGIQASVEVTDFAVQMTPETESVAIDATPAVIDTGIMVVPVFTEQAVETDQETDSSAEDSIARANGDAKHAGAKAPSLLSSYLQSPATGLLSFTSKIVHFYSYPFRYVYSFMPAISSSPDALSSKEVEPSSPIPGGMEDSFSEKPTNGHAVVDGSPVGL